jgi:glycosyltransferase involved in cell wall biosynthesis
VVFALQEGGPLVERIERLGVPVEVIGNGRLRRFGLTRALARRLRAHRVDVLHTHNPAPHQHGALARLVTGVPALLHTMHGRNTTVVTPAARLAERIAGHLSQLVVPVSLDAADVARDDLRVPEHKLRVIHNGIAIDQFATAPVLARGRAPRAVHVARLNPIKGQATLLEAARLTAERVPGFTLDIVGDGPAGPALREQARQAGLDDVVRFHGMQDDVVPFLLAADLFVLSSLSEGIALTLLEAMGSGLPVVATDVGGNREVVVHGDTGLLVPVGDPARLADGICEVIRDPARAQGWGHAARARVETDFNITRTVASYESAYLELLGRKRF